MESFSRRLQGLFDRGHELLVRASEHWRTHTNRRTIFILLVAAIVATYGYLNYIQPPDEFPLGTLVTVPEGSTLTRTAALLERQGVVRSAFALKAAVEVFGHDRQVHAGDYIFKEPRDVVSVARVLIAGAYGLEPERIRVPEGATVKEMAVIFAGHLQRFDAERFLASALPQEGYLFPDTYFFLPNATDQTVLNTMRQNFEQQIMSLQPAIDASGHSLKDIVTLASLVEREARDSTDRRMIAGVLWNRLKKGMLLQVDAAFLYTLGKGTFQLTMQDLKSDSPYNTYRYKGLPPTPIGSPSLDSLRAAVSPIENDYYFYLADSRHVTHYCKTWECQQANKRLYFSN